MRPDKADIDHTVWIVDPDHDAIFVAGDVKDDAAIPEDAGIADVFFDICGPCPVSLLHLPEPGHQGLAGIGNIAAPIEKRFDRTERDDPHSGHLNIVPTWDHKFPTDAGPVLIIPLNSLPIVFGQ